MRSKSVGSVLVFATLTLLVTGKGKHSHGKRKESSKKKSIGSSKRGEIVGDPYESIGPVLSPVHGYSSSEVVGTSRWGIPYEGYVRQYVKRPAQHYVLEPQPIHVDPRYGYYSREGYAQNMDAYGAENRFHGFVDHDMDNFPEYSFGPAFRPRLPVPHNLFHDIEPLHGPTLSDPHLRHATQANLDKFSVHVSARDGPGYPHSRADHYNLDTPEGIASIVGHVLSDRQANKLGFDGDYMKMIGYNDHHWDTQSNYGHAFDGGQSELNDWGAGNWHALPHAVHEEHAVHPFHHGGHHEVHHAGHHLVHPDLHEPLFQGNCRVPMDIAFLIDGSTEKDHFHEFITFMLRIVRKFGVSLDGTHIALVMFSDKGELKFDFDKFHNPHEIEHELLHIVTDYSPKKGRALGNGLKIAKGSLFDSSGRDEISRVLIVLTDGSAGDTFGPEGQAIKDAGVNVYVVVVPMTRDISTGKYSERQTESMYYTSPKTQCYYINCAAAAPKGTPNPTQVNDLATSKEGGHAFIVDDYHKMHELAYFIPFITCKVDIVFVIDCTKTDNERLNKIKDFIKHTTVHLSIGKFGDHVSVVTYGGSAEIQFNLNKKHTGYLFLEALESLTCKGGAADVGPGLSKAKDVFEESGHFGYLNLTVLVTDSKAGSDVVDSSQDLRNMGVLIHAVGFGTQVAPDELSKIATDPDDFYVHRKNDANQLRAVAEKLVEDIDSLRGHHSFSFGSVETGHLDGHNHLEGHLGVPVHYGSTHVHVANHHQHPHAKHAESVENDLHDILAVERAGPLGDLGVGAGITTSRSEGLENLGDMIAQNEKFFSTYSEKAPARSFSPEDHGSEEEHSTAAEFEMENTDERQNIDSGSETSMAGYSPQLPDGSFMSVPTASFGPNEYGDSDYEYRGKVPNNPEDGNITAANESNAQNNKTSENNAPINNGTVISENATSFNVSINQRNATSVNGSDHVASANATQHVTTGKQRSETDDNSEFLNVTQEKNNAKEYMAAGESSSGNKSMSTHEGFDPYSQIGQAASREMNTPNFKSFLASNSTGPSSSSDVPETIEINDKNNQKSHKKSKNAVHTDIVNEKSEFEEADIEEKKYVDGKNEIELSNGDGGKDIVKKFSKQKRKKHSSSWAEKAYKHFQKAIKLEKQLASKQIKERKKEKGISSNTTNKSKSNEKTKGQKKNKNSSSRKEIRHKKVTSGKVSKKQRSTSIKEKLAKLNASNLSERKGKTTSSSSAKETKAQKSARPNTVTVTETEDSKIVSEESMMEEQMTKPTENVIDDAKKKSYINQKLKGDDYDEDSDDSD